MSVANSRRVRDLDPALIDALNACVYQAITTRIRKGPEYETKKGFGDAI